MIELPRRHGAILEVYGKLRVLRSGPSSNIPVHTQYVTIYNPRESRPCSFIGVDLSESYDPSRSQTTQLQMALQHVDAQPHGQSWKDIAQQSAAKCRQKLNNQRSSATAASLADSFDTFKKHFADTFDPVNDTIFETFTMATGVLGKMRLRSAANVIASAIVSGSCPNGNNRVPFLATGNVCTDPATGLMFRTATSAVFHLAGGKSSNSAMRAIITVAGTHLDDTETRFVDYRLRAKCMHSTDAEDIENAIADANDISTSVFVKQDSTRMTDVDPEPPAALAALDFIKKRLTMDSHTISAIAPNSWNDRASKLQDSWSRLDQPGLLNDLKLGVEIAIVSAVFFLIGLLSIRWNDSKDNARNVISKRLGLISLAALYGAATFSTLFDGVNCGQGDDIRDSGCPFYSFVHYTGVVFGMLCTFEFFSRGVAIKLDTEARYAAIMTDAANTDEAEHNILREREEALEQAWRGQCCTADCAQSCIDHTFHGTNAVCKNTLLCISRVFCCGCTSVICRCLLSPYTMFATTLFASVALQSDSQRSGETVSTRHFCDCDKWQLWLVPGLAIGGIVAVVASGSDLGSEDNVIKLVLLSLASAALTALVLRHSTRDGSNQFAIYITRIAACCLHAILVRTFGITGWTCPIAFLVWVCVRYIPVSKNKTTANP